MQRFLSSYQYIFYELALGITILTLLGMAGGDRLVSRSQQFAATANCLSYEVGACSTTNSPGLIHHADTQAAGRTNHNQPPLKKSSKARPKLPAATSALKVYPTPVATNPPISISSPGQSAVAAMIEQVFGAYAPAALQVARCESGLNARAYNPTSIGGNHAEGVFQILYPSTWMGTPEAASSPYNAMANILAAHSIFVRDGYSWREWSCQP